MLPCCLPVRVVGIHQYNGYNQHKFRKLSMGLTVGFAVMKEVELAELVVDSIASASASWSSHIYSELEPQSLC